MADTEEEFQALIEGWRRSDQTLIQRLVEQYGTHVRRALRRVMHPKLRAQFDSVDFAQLMWMSLFRMPDGAERCGSEAELVAFLVKMAKHKLLDEQRRLESQGRDVRRELPLSETIERDCRTGRGHVAAIEQAIARERLERYLADQPEHYRAILQGRLAGEGIREIATALDLDETTVRRFLKGLSERDSD